MNRYSIIPNQNQWLNNLIGKIASDKLFEDARKYLFENGDRCDILGDLRKKALVVCINPSDNCIDGIGGSSILYDNLKNRTVENLILDNFGLAFAALQVSPATSAGTTLTDDANTGQLFNMFASSPFNTSLMRTQIKLGSGVTPPSRADIKIQTSLPSAPESGYLDINGTGGYTASNQIVYQGDANPTGGTGAVTEIGSFGKWITTLNNPKLIMLCHDVISPQINFTANKLLRGSYAWQI